MITLANLDIFWKTYFQDTQSINGLDSWTVVYMAKDSDRLLISLANPFEEKHEDVFLDHIADEDLVTFVKLYKERFIDQLGLRFGLFKPETNKVLTEYTDWDSFYQTWINNDPKLLQLNFPLLFDFPTKDEYTAMGLKDADYAGYRRLLVVVYQYRKAKFHRVFVKGIDDKSFEHIKKQISDLFNRSLNKLILNSLETRHE